MIDPPVELDNELANQLAALLKELLEQERRSVTGASEQRQDELRHAISSREAQLEDDTQLDRWFTDYLETLPEEQRPKGTIAMGLKVAEWHSNFKSQLNDWKNELARLEGQPVDKQAIFNSTRNKVMHLLQCEARAAGLLPPDDSGPGDELGDDDKDNGITQDELIPYIVKGLKRHGGRARKDQVEHDVYELLKDTLKAPYYHEPDSYGVLRWKKNLAWARTRAEKKGLIQSPAESGRGWWALTELGHRFDV